METFVTRFAPSPSGYLHLGHVLSALTAYKTAFANAGRFLLRIEDIDSGRSRAEYEAAIYEDLTWLGLTWETPVRRQSEHLLEYRNALTRLYAMKAVYPCFCSRRKAAKAGGEQYSGTCRNLSREEAAERMAQGHLACWRLNAQKAAEMTGPLFWEEFGHGLLEARAVQYGDAVIARRDVPASYHLAVTVDDEVQGVTHIIRGKDLFSSTPIHRTLQTLLGFRAPRYFHHELLMDQATGRKLSKRDGSASLREWRLSGRTAAEVMLKLKLEQAWQRSI